MHKHLPKKHQKIHKNNNLKIPKHTFQRNSLNIKLRKNAPLSFNSLQYRMILPLHLISQPAS